jgi:hypothetical protein
VCVCVFVRQRCGVACRHLKAFVVGVGPECGLGEFLVGEKEPPVIDDFKQIW